MARNRPDRTREDKTAEIVAIARRLFLEQGYEGTTIAAIAREAGIATNVVHWYFATKDDLFVSVLDSLRSEDLERAKERLSRATPGREEKAVEALLTEFVWQRLDRHGLIATLHERSHRSSVMAEFHDRPIDAMRTTWGERSIAARSPPATGSSSSRPSSPPWRGSSCTAPASARPGG